MTALERDNFDISGDLQDVLTAAGVLASIMELDGQWTVRLRRGMGIGLKRSSRWVFADDDRDEFLAVLTDQLEAAAGVRPVVETE